MLLFPFVAWFVSVALILYPVLVAQVEKFFELFPEFVSNSFFITGESYGGILSIRAISYPGVFINLVMS